MTASVKDYEDVLEGLLADIARMRDAVSCAVLFGSMARGDVMPGHSDMMDVFVFLKHDLFDDKARFLESLEVMAEACEKIADKSPGPFHPFFYWSETDPIPATFALDITVHSKVVFGEDIRSRLNTTVASRSVAQTSFFEMRRLGSPLMVYLHKKELTEQDCGAIFNLLMAIKRDLPMLALMVLGIWVVQKESIPALKEAVPDVNYDILDRIVAIQQDQAERTDPRVLQMTLRDAMIFVESLNDRLITHVNARSQA
ncbi:MAG: nucleotidyltransferase domain-containing protein [Acidobacteria bacterium]|nr:nucleotidyltransferase domain-containing protein [Acidobacteriota bacterium]